MKRFCGTQVMMLMAGFAVSSAWGQTADQAHGSYRVGPDEVLKISRDGTAELTQGNFFELAQAVVLSPPQPPQGPQMVPSTFRQNFGTGEIFAGGMYNQGKIALDRRDYKRAVEVFGRMIKARGQQVNVDGAYYWKAYALNKLGRTDEALATLAELSTKFPQSRWLKDAKALQAEVQQAKGQPVSPENQADEDLKLYAINELMSSDAERAVPLLEGLLDNPKVSPNLKNRALFVLAQSPSEKAHEIVGRYGKGGSNPDLQVSALMYLGEFRSKQSQQLLADIYASTSDIFVRRAVLVSLKISRDAEHLTAIVKSEQNVELRRQAIRQLGSLRGNPGMETLVSIYGSESDRDSRREILNSLANQGAVKQLIECARKESDPELKKIAVERLAGNKSKEAMDFMAELLK